MGVLTILSCAGCMFADRRCSHWHHPASP